MHSIRRRLQPLAAAAALCALIVTGTACSTASDTLSAPEPGPARTVDFSARQLAGPNLLALRLARADAESATLEIVVKDPAQPVTGAAVEIQFDPASLSFEAVTAGAFLGGPAPIASAALSRQQPGRLVAVFAQRDLAQGRAGSGTLGSVTFRLQPGQYSNALAFVPQASTLFGRKGAPLTGEAFAGGTLKVQGGA
jgi:hypothetical protein